MTFPHKPCSKNSTSTAAVAATICLMVETSSPSLQQLLDRVAQAQASGAPLRIRGGGSKDFYGERLAGEVLDTRGHSGIVAYEPSELYVTARCGTPLIELEAVLAEQGQCLAFEPPHFSANTRRGPEDQPPHTHTSVRAEPVEAMASRATVGGMVAAGLSGPSRASVGALRDYVLGLQLINGKAEHLTFGGQVMKNVAGYDVSRLIAGSLGVLGVITEVSLKVLPTAPAEATLLFDMAQAQALKALNDWGGQPLPLNASNWVHDGERDCLFVRLRGAVAAVEAGCHKMGGERLSNAAVAADWEASRNLTLPFFQNPAADHCLWRVSVPQSAPPLDLPHAQLIEWHGALRWLWAPAAQAARIRQAAHAIGGSASIFIAAYAMNTPAIARFDALNPATERIHRELKKQFDPAGVFNPGRLGVI
jgi:glycolate oxidase FAD binding subunit